MEDNDIKYSKNHIWVRIEDDFVYIGVTEAFLENIDEIVEINLPKAGEDIEIEEPFGSIDNGEDLVELISPISGEVLKVNKKIVKDPAILLEDPQGEGWLLKVEPYDWDELDNLLTQEEYEREI
ncbi:MAG: glycine cleavage system protein H [Proteobacteria bacterium]|nr:glycine cleavage system protein H [Pseudomonadota bacterium]